MRRLPTAVFFDAYGTLISFRQDVAPAEAVHRGLAQAGVALPFEVVERALAVEMAFYRERQAHVRTPEQLAELRQASAQVLRDGLGGVSACPLDLPAVLSLILDAFKTVVLPDALPAIGRLRGAGVRTGVLSNFSYLLPLLLRELGLSALLDPVVFSAAAGAEKPLPAIFRAAAGAVDTRPSDCVLLGDDLRADVEGARGAGMPVIWIARNGGVPPPGVRLARSLTDAAEAVLCDDWRRFSLGA
ncbi:MAG: HAD-IA family hydrolase [Actinobacteria bacterium]|nr:HAD-IA family hydrolase [Actinomycetota bacterium]